MRAWFLTGFSGAGKTLIGERLARLSGREPFDLDSGIEAASGLPVAQLLRTRGEPAFRELEREVLDELLRRLREQPLAVVSLGAGALDEPERWEAVRNAGVVAWLDVPLATCLRRLRADVNRPRPVVERLEAEGGLEAVRALERARRSVFSRAHLRVDGRGSPYDVTRRLLRALEEPDLRRASG